MAEEKNTYDNYEEQPVSGPHVSMQSEVSEDGLPTFGTPEDGHDDEEGWRPTFGASGSRTLPENEAMEDEGRGEKRQASSHLLYEEAGVRSRLGTSEAPWGSPQGQKRGHDEHLDEEEAGVRSRAVNQEEPWDMNLRRICEEAASEVGVNIVAEGSN